jgi:hypothetical protein
MDGGNCCLLILGVAQPKKMDTTPNKVICDWCKCPVSETNIEKHKTLRCPNAPAEIIAARPERPPRGSFRIFFNLVSPEPPAPDRLPTTPSSQDRQINRKAEVYRSRDGVFYVHSVLSSGGLRSYSLKAECEYCHHTIEVTGNGPSVLPQFAKDEACRLALLEHLRKDVVHSLKQKNKPEAVDPT